MLFLTDSGLVVVDLNSADGTVVNSASPRAKPGDNRCVRHGPASAGIGSHIAGIFIDFRRNWG
jgi:hypothetical protein